MRPQLVVRYREGQKTKANKRQHKAARMRELLMDGRATAKEEAQMGRRAAWQARRVEAAFRGCEVQ